MYDTRSQKGTKRKTLPSPRVIDFDATATYMDVVKRAKESFFPENTDDMNAYSLAGTSGIPFDVDNKENWVIGEFLKEHGYQPSKLRLYIIYDPEKVSKPLFHVLLIHIRSYYNSNDDSIDDNTDYDDSSVDCPPLTPPAAPRRPFPPLAPPLVARRPARQTSPLIAGPKLPSPLVPPPSHQIVSPQGVCELSPPRSETSSECRITL